MPQELPDVNNKDTQAIQEIKKELPLAEDIARFRAELEQNIFNEGLPKDEWKKKEEELLDKYPQVKPYRGMFDLALQEAEKYRENMEDILREHKAETIERTGPNLQVEKINTTAAKEIFRYLFKFAPEGEIGVFKGAVSLRISVNDSDYKKIRGHKEEEIMSAGFADTIKGVQVMVLRMNTSSMEIAHELEHIKNHIVGMGKIAFRPEKLYITKQAASRLLHRDSWKDSYPEKRGKDELLAYFTILQGASTFPDKALMREELDLYAQHVKDLLTNPKGSYYKSHDLHVSSEADRNQYIKSVTRGADALISMFNLYMELESNFDPGRMAINILEQFPLSSWPAVVRFMAKNKQK